MKISGHLWKRLNMAAHWRLFLAVFMAFACLLFASIVQRWIRDVQKCSSLNQLWPEFSKLKSAGTALNIAENAKISESALKMTEYLLVNWYAWTSYTRNEESP